MGIGFVVMFLRHMARRWVVVAACRSREYGLGFRGSSMRTCRVPSWGFRGVVFPLRCAWCMIKSSGLGVGE